MKALLIIATTCIVVIKARPKDATITRYNFDHIGKGYSYSWESSDGTKRGESAEILNEGQENESIAVKGSYEYVGLDNIVYRVVYIADENGFQPVVSQNPGTSIPGQSIQTLSGGASPPISSHALISLGGGTIG